MAVVLSRKPGGSGGGGAPSGPAGGVLSGTYPNPSGFSAAGLALMPGHELAYTEVTSPVAVSATTEGTANTVVTAAAVACDGVSPVLVEFYASSGQVGTNGQSMSIALFMDGSAIGLLAFYTMISKCFYGPYQATRRIVPAAGSRTFSVRAFLGGGSAGSIQAGAGASDFMPAYIRVTVA